MALAFSQLVAPQNQATWLQFLLTGLQGVSPVIQIPAPGTNQLSGTGTLSVQGPALSDGPVVIKITTTGNADNSSPAQFQYSLDGGTTYNPPSPVDMSTLGPGFSYAIPTVGVVVSFENGAYTTASSGGFSFVLGETYDFNCATPTFPVTNWPAVGVANSLVQVDSQALSDLNVLVAQAIAGGFTQSWINPPLVNGIPTAPPDGWLDLLGQSMYDRDRTPALTTQGLGVLTASSNAGPYTILPQQLLAANAGGQYVFSNTNGGTLSQGGTLALTWEAVAPGSNYNRVLSFGVGDPSYWLTALITPLAGVSLTNPLQPIFPATQAMSHSGTGSGTMTLGADTSAGPANEYNIIVRILVSGGLGTGTFKVSTDGGNSFGSPQSIPGGGTFGPVGATNMDLNFTGTFDAGDTYGGGTSWITQRGVDQQTSQNYAVACQNQWATLAPGAPDGQYVIWAQEASPEVVTALVIPDPVVPGQVDITLIGAGNGPVSAGAITAVQNFITPRAPLCISISVGTVSTLSVQVEAAYIVVKAAFRKTIGGTLQQALTAYQGTVLPQGVVELSKVAAIIQDTAGVIEIEPLSSLTLNGTAANVPLTANQVPQILGPPGSSFQFV